MKRMHVGIAAGIASLFLMPAVAFAEEGTSSGAEILIPKTAEFIPALVSFLIIWALLAKFAWPKVLAMLQKREQTIQASVDEADQIKAEAASARDEADSLVAEARRKASEIVLAAREDGEKERARIVADARADAEDIIAKARDHAADEQRRIYANATDSIAKVSVAVAGKIVGDVLADDEEKQRELIKKYISEVGSLR